MGSVEGFGLQVGAALAVKSVIDGYGGGLVESHEFGEVGEDGGDEGVVGRQIGDCGGTDVDRRCRVDRVAAGDFQVVFVDFQRVEALRL